MAKDSGAPTLHSLCDSLYRLYPVAYDMLRDRVAKVPIMSYHDLVDLRGYLWQWAPLGGPETRPVFLAMAELVQDEVNAKLAAL